jgi:hypothetical protein
MDINVKYYQSGGYYHMKPMGNRSKIIPITIVVLLGFLLVPQLQLVANASSNSPYESGYDHGCDDSDKSYNDRYINEEGKGPSFHTDAFMRGHNAGVNCSDSDNNDNDNNDNNSNNNNRNDDDRNQNHNQERSFIGTAADGYEEGRIEGYNDWNDRSKHNSQCPPNDSWTWCAGFKGGYEVGWSSGGY